MAKSNTMKSDFGEPFNRQQAERVYMAYVIQVARRYRSQLDEHLRSLGCGTAAMETMSAVADSRRALSQVEIAQRMGIEGPTLTRMLALLEQKDWIVRIPDPKDGRAKKIQLTDEGKKMLAKVRKVADRIRSSTLAEVEAPEMEASTASLHKVLQSLLGAK